MLKNTYTKWGLTAFCTVAAILLFYDTLFGSSAVIHFGVQLLNAAQPVLYGAFFAYFLAPMVNFIEKHPTGVPSRLLHGEPGSRKKAKALRAFSILLTWTLVAILLYVLFSVLIPELYRSIQQLIQNVETYYRTINGWVEELLANNPSLEAWAIQQMENYYGLLQDWLKEDLLPKITILMGALSDGVFNGVFALVGFVGDLLVGVIVSVYFLAAKEAICAQARKAAYGVFPQNQVHWVLRGVQQADRIFSGFVRGKLLDSLIIGCLCWVGCSLMNMPYTVLVSVIVGITNIIPFFGPFLGAIPSIFLILLVSPIKALYFSIFVLALQQLDGNVIGPKILGDKTGLSSLLVILAILVGGSFFGVAGMFFGVPVFACLYNLVMFIIDTMLKKKGLPVDTTAYSTSAEQKREQRDSK